MANSILSLLHYIEPMNAFRTCGVMFGYIMYFAQLGTIGGGLSRYFGMLLLRNIPPQVPDCICLYDSDMQKSKPKISIFCTFVGIFLFQN